jgi:hypothetical protein
MEDVQRVFDQLDELRPAKRKPKREKRVKQDDKAWYRAHYQTILAGLKERRPKKRS